MNPQDDRLTPVLPPRVVDDADDIQWHRAAEVVLVGYGGAGVLAALEARENGLSVLALDRFEGGGATDYSVGVMYAAGTDHQRALGVQDDAEEMYKYLLAEGNAVSPETLKTFCETSADNLSWTEKHGAMRGSVLDGETLVYTSGNERLRGDCARPAPRGHKAATKGLGGRFFYRRLFDSAAGMGVDLVAHAPVRRLVVDRTGRVVGVEARVLPSSRWHMHRRLASAANPYRPFRQRHFETAAARAVKLEEEFGELQLFRATAGVIITAGGFTLSPEMIRQHRPDVYRNYTNMVKFAALGCDGSGIRLAESAGAGTSHMDQLLLGRFMSPPTLARGILVNSAGQRFVNENAYVCDLGEAIAGLGGGGAWMIVSAQEFWSAVWQSLTNFKLLKRHGLPALLNMALGGTRRGRNAARMAGKIGVDADALGKTIRDYNALAEQGKRDPVGKLPEFMRPLGSGPYYAINWAFDNPFGFMVTFTLGGATVSEQSGAVTRADGSEIAGLYAAGRSAVGLCSQGYDAGGLAISDAVFSARRAARSIAGAKAAAAPSRI